MIFCAFNNYDIKLFSYKKICDYLLLTLSQFTLKLKNFKKTSLRGAHEVGRGAGPPLACNRSFENAYEHPIQQFCDILYSPTK